MIKWVSFNTIMLMSHLLLTESYNDIGKCTDGVLAASGIPHMPFLLRDIFLIYEAHGNDKEAPQDLINKVGNAIGIVLNLQVHTALLISTYWSGRFNEPFFGIQHRSLFDIRFFAKILHMDR